MRDVTRVGKNWKGFIMIRSRMMRSLTGLASGLLLVSGLGCQNKVHDENLALHQQNRELQTRLSTEEDKLRQAPDPAQLASLQRDIADRDAKIAELQANLKKPAPGNPADPSLAGIETTYDAKAGTLTVNIPGDVLFPSGKAELRPAALGTLDKIAGAIRKDYSGKAVRVNGYTDSDPISKTKEQWDDNWDLSYARAKSVTNYLTSHGIDSKQLAIVANGPNKSKATTPQSRRVENVVLVR
jgi:flagellar motor protein MotB